jgi:hypothetical protein
MTYITVDEMDALGNATWDALDIAAKDRAVAQANAWLAARSFMAWDDQPPPITVAAQELALEAAEGRLYSDATTGTISRKKVRAGSVETETAFEGGATATPGAIQYVEDLIRPYLAGSGAVRILRKL